MYKAVILADDLTGALDTGVQLAQKGIPVEVLSRAARSFPEAAAPVLAVNLDTRHASAREAYERTKEAARLAKASRAFMLYIKTDSGLRGNVGAALSAAVEGWGESLAFVPAYPENGRTVRDGLLYVCGVPVSKSILGHDLHNPVVHDSVQDILREQCSLPVLAAARGNGNKSSRAIHLYEAACEADMAAAARAVREGGFTLAAGCAGFSKYLPELLSLPVCETPLPQMPAPLMVLSGSTSEVALKQLRRAQACGFSAVPFPDLLSQAPDFSALNTRIIEALARGGALLAAAVNESGVQEVSGQAREMGLSTLETGDRIAGNLGRAAARLLDSGFSGTLLVFGGDTLKACLREAGDTQIRPLREIAGGVVVCEIITGKYRGSIITKSGSFGSDELVMDIKAMLSKAQPKNERG